MRCATINGTISLRSLFYEFQVGQREVGRVEDGVNENRRRLFGDLVHLDLLDEVVLAAQRVKERCEELVAAAPRRFVEDVPNTNDEPFGARPRRAERLVFEFPCAGTRWFAEHDLPFGGDRRREQAVVDAVVVGAAAASSRLFVLDGRVLERRISRLERGDVDCAPLGRRRWVAHIFVD